MQIKHFYKCEWVCTVWSWGVHQMETCTKGWWGKGDVGLWIKKGWGIINKNQYFRKKKFGHVRPLIEHYCAETRVVWRSSRK